jgi:hypothetical protein
MSDAERQLANIARRVAPIRVGSASTRRIAALEAAVNRTHVEAVTWRLLTACLVEQLGGKAMITAAQHAKLGRVVPHIAAGPDASYTVELRTESVGGWGRWSQRSPMA